MIELYSAGVMTVLYRGVESGSIAFAMRFDIYKANWGA